MLSKPSYRFSVTTYVLLLQIVPKEVSFPVNSPALSAPVLLGESEWKSSSGSGGAQSSTSLSTSAFISNARSLFLNFSNRTDTDCRRRKCSGKKIAGYQWPRSPAYLGDCFGGERRIWLKYLTWHRATQHTSSWDSASHFVNWKPASEEQIGRFSMHCISRAKVKESKGEILDTGWSNQHLKQVPGTK